MGYCLGGRLAFMMAEQSDADVNISYYGVGLDNLLNELAKVTRPLLVHIADKDEFFPAEGRAKVVEATKGRPQSPATSIRMPITPSPVSAACTGMAAPPPSPTAAARKHSLRQSGEVALGPLLLVALSVAAVPARAWDDFQIIEWQHRDATQLATLKRLGVTAATILANRDGSGTPVERQFVPMLANGLRWYVENIATDYYSAYHRWSPPHPVNWRFLDAQQRYRARPDDEVRSYGASRLGRSHLATAHPRRLIATVREQMRHRPLYLQVSAQNRHCRSVGLLGF